MKKPVILITDNTVAVKNIFSSLKKRFNTVHQAVFYYHVLMVDNAMLKHITRVVIQTPKDNGGFVYKEAPYYFLATPKIPLLSIKQEQKVHLVSLKASDLTAITNTEKLIWALIQKDSIPNILNCERTDLLHQFFDKKIARLKNH